MLPLVQATALMLQQEADRWEKDGNQYIQAIKQLSENMNILTKYAKRPDSGTVSRILFLINSSFLDCAFILQQFCKQ